MTRTCSDCTYPIGPRNRTGRCRSCVARHLNTDPGVKERRVAGIKAHYDDPVNRQRVADRAKLLCATLPEHERERRRLRGIELAPLLIAAARLMTPEKRAENGRKRSDTVLAWCPEEWRDTYRQLKLRGRRSAEAKCIVLDVIAGKPMPEMYAHQRQRLAWCPPDMRDAYATLRGKTSAAEAKCMILEEIAAKKAKLTPFERQMEKVRNGAKLIERPSYRCADPAMTLGGVSAGLL